MAPMRSHPRGRERFVLQLIAVGPDPKLRVRHPLSAGETYTIGRSPEALLPIPWEESLSRVHLQLKVTDGGVVLERVPQARNPVFVGGEEVTKRRLSGGDSFVVGETRFVISKGESESSSGVDSPVEEVVFTRKQLEQVRYEDPDRRIEVLSRLPDVIWGARTEAERDSRLVNLLLTGVRNAEAAAIVALGSDGHIQLRSWERRRETAGAFRPSRRLILEAIQQGQTILHLWDSTEAEASDYTLSGEFDWAYCTPVGQHRGQQWALYVGGRLAPLPGQESSRARAPHLQSDVKFTELLADVLSSIERQNKLEGTLSVLRQFLSPPILAAIERAGDGSNFDTDLLNPRECDVTVLFCDLRGFSHRAEGASGDLHGLLNRVSRALEVMTQKILDHGGVTGDFLGDAALGFWGWPFASDEAPLNACRAALGIRRAFAETRKTPGHPLADFEMGIGIAHGRAVAGKIGTSDRVTVTVFGPVVNLASRLESMTKQLRVPILLDEATADIVRKRFPADEGRTRRLARVLPYGMENPLTVTELLPPLDDYPDLTNEHLSRYEQGVEHFIAGRWDQAYRCLHEMPSSDQAQDFLTLRIAQHGRTPPAGWKGIVELPKQ